MAAAGQPSKLPLPAASSTATANYEYLDELEGSPRAARAEPLLTPRRSVSLVTGPPSPATVSLTGAVGAGVSNPLPLTSVFKSRLERTGSTRRAQRVAAAGGGGAEDDVEISSCSSSEADDAEMRYASNASLLASIDNMSLHMTLSSTHDAGAGAAGAADAAGGPSSPRRRFSALTAHSHSSTHAAASAPQPPAFTAANSAIANSSQPVPVPVPEPALEPVLENETVHVTGPPDAAAYSTVIEIRAQLSERSSPLPLTASSNNAQPLAPASSAPVRPLPPPPPPPVPPRSPRTTLASNNSVMVLAPARHSEGKSINHTATNFQHDRFEFLFA